VAVLLRLAGTFVRQLARVGVTVYDILIVLPLMLERLVRERRSAEAPVVDSPRVAPEFEAAGRS
jgi:hypothetical protein